MKQSGKATHSGSSVTHAATRRIDSGIAGATSASAEMHTMIAEHDAWKSTTVAAATRRLSPPPWYAASARRDAL